MTMSLRRIAYTFLLTSKATVFTSEESNIRRDFTDKENKIIMVEWKKALALDLSQLELEPALCITLVVWAHTPFCASTFL